MSGLIIAANLQSDSVSCGCLLCAATGVFAVVHSQMGQVLTQHEHRLTARLQAASGQCNERIPHHSRTSSGRVEGHTSLELSPEDLLQVRRYDTL
jgi:hypothetical protein